MKEKRVEVLKVRASTRELSALKQLASREGRSVSEMLRELVRGEAARRGLWPGTPIEQRETAAIAE